MERYDLKEKLTIRNPVLGLENLISCDRSENKYYIRIKIML